MQAFLPSGAAVVAMVAVILAAQVCLGWWIASRVSASVARPIAWIELVVVVLGVDRVCASEPAGVRMLALIATAMLAMKTLVLVEDRARSGCELGFARWLAFALLWPGMRPHLFARRSAAALPGARRMILVGGLRFVLGALLVAAARFAADGMNDRVGVTALLLVGSSMAVHFGLFDAITGIGRLAGIAGEEPFRAPWRSQNLAEFWGTRWNLAFSEMTALAVFRPLATRIGPGRALLGSFVLSGLLHEMAISLPVRAGFGLPFAYFALHGMLVWIERELARRGLPLRGWLGRAWVFVWLVAPLQLLFHQPFLAGVVWPIAGID